MCKGLTRTNQISESTNDIQHHSQCEQKPSKAPHALTKQTKKQVQRGNKFEWPPMSSLPNDFRHARQCVTNCTKIFLIKSLDGWWTCEDT